MEIYVHTLTGAKAAFVVKETDTILSLKEKIFSKWEVPICEQAIIFGGYSLTQYDDRTLRELNITPKATLHMTLKLQGGGPSQESDK